MKNKKILSLASLYQEKLFSYGADPIACDEAKRDLTKGELANHALWLTHRVKSLMVDFQREEAILRIGIIKGILLALDIYSLGELKKH